MAMEALREELIRREDKDREIDTACFNDEVCRRIQTQLEGVSHITVVRRVQGDE